MILIGIAVAPLMFSQNVGIGTTNPVAKLDVVGNLKITDGTQGSGKVLTSDANGLASWQSPPAADTTNYPVVWICCTPWMASNLNVSTYQNGDSIPLVTDNQAWFELTTGAYCYFNNDPANEAIYGKLYNWYAVNDPRGLAPEGWHIPTDFEWTTLVNCLGGDGVAGGPMKEIGTAIWYPPNTGATNYTGFNGRPGGFRHHDGYFPTSLSYYGYFWSATEQYTNSVYYAWFRALLYYDDDLGRDGLHKRTGCSVRCVKD